jgi:hypothetical protein
MLFATREELDYVASIDTMMYGNLLSCDSMAYDFDMGRDLWLTKQRWTILQKDYLELHELEDFLDRCKAIGLGEAKRGVVTQMFAKQHARRHKKYRWGNCMLGWSFMGGNRYEQPTLALHSRVSYIAYIGGLDLALCHVIGREIAERIGCGVEDIAFRWYVDSLQFHGFKSVPYLFRFGLDEVLREDTKRYPSSEYPTLKLVRRWWKTVDDWYEEGKSLEEQKYGPLKRIIKRYAQYKDGDPLPSVPIRNLSLRALREAG